MVEIIPGDGLTLGLTELLGDTDGDTLGDTELLGDTEALGEILALGLTLGETEGLTELDGDTLADGLMLALGEIEGETEEEGDPPTGAIEAATIPCADPDALPKLTDIEPVLTVPLLSPIPAIDVPGFCLWV